MYCSCEWRTYDKDHQQETHLGGYWRDFWLWLISSKTYVAIGRPHFIMREGCFTVEITGLEIRHTWCLAQVNDWGDSRTCGEWNGICTDIERAMKASQWKEWSKSDVHLWTYNFINKKWLVDGRNGKFGVNTKTWWWELFGDHASCLRQMVLKCAGKRCERL